MSVLVLSTSAFVQQQLEALRALAPDETFHTDVESAPAREVEAILAFKLRAGIAPRFPNLRFVACAGAGADELLAAEDLPAVPIVRPMDDLQAQRIAQYVTLMVLRFHRDLPILEGQHRAAAWRRLVQRDEARTRVGILGFGASGKTIARALAALGFPVRAWRRTGGVAHDDMVLSSGLSGLHDLLAHSDIVVCALPLTPETRGAVGRAALLRLPAGAYLIDVSRGGVVDHDALRALVDAQHLAGAALDVFAQEPLPAESPLWKHPRILCTPHVAGTPRPDVAAAQFLDNLQRARRGEPLRNTIDRARGY